MTIFYVNIYLTFLPVLIYGQWTGSRKELTCFDRALDGKVGVLAFISVA